MRGVPVVPEVVASVYRLRNRSPIRAGSFSERARFLDRHRAVGGPLIETRHEPLLVGHRQQRGILDPLREALVQLAVEGRVSAREGHQLGESSPLSLRDRCPALLSGYVRVE